MHVAQLANFVWPGSGGLKVVLQELGARYVAAGHRVTRIVPGEQDDTTCIDGVQVISIKSPRIPLLGGYRVIVDIRRIETLLDEIAPDSIELSDKTTLLRASRRIRRSGVPVVLLSHERLDAILAPRVPSWFPLAAAADAWNRHLAANVDAVVCASEFAADEFRRIDAPQIRRIKLGVDLANFRPGRDESSTQRSIVCIGRLSSEKRPATAIETVRELNRRGTDVRLTMIGDGPERAALERAAGGLPVSFVGHIDDRDRLAALIRSADAAIAPCPYETFGLGALEALACGTPIVVPDAGALAELVAGTGAGRAVSDVPVAYADALGAVFAGDRSAQRRAARERAEGFDWSDTSIAMQQIHADVIASRLEHSGAGRPLLAAGTSSEVLGVGQQAFMCSTSAREVPLVRSGP